MLSMIVLNICQATYIIHIILFQLFVQPREQHIPIITITMI